MEAYSLVMPFVSVASKGGPFEDAAYCAGYEMGRLDRDLAHGLGGAHVIRAENQAQADLIAMRHGYLMETHESGYDEWVYAQFTRSPDGLG